MSICIRMLVSEMNQHANSLASYPGLPMFFNIHEKNREGLVDFGDVMDVVCDDTDWNE